MEYSFLSNFSSLIEVFTAVYVSMFIDELLSGVWTPTYKQKISGLIKAMKIPTVKYFVKQVEDNIDQSATTIKNHMKQKAMFFVVFCMGLLLLAGLEAHSICLPKYGYLIVTILSFFVLCVTLFGRWIFCKYSRVVVAIAIYTILFCVLYFTDLPEYLTTLDLSVNDRFATCVFLTALTLPILWQLFLIWVYSSLYKGYMQEKVARESYLYGKAFISYKLREVAILPLEYEKAARDFVVIQAQDGDTSLGTLNSILVGRLETLCYPPHALTVFWSWVKFNLRGRKTPEALYIEKNGFDYESIVGSDGLNEVIPTMIAKEKPSGETAIDQTEEDDGAKE